MALQKRSERSFLKQALWTHILYSGIKLYITQGNGCGKFGRMVASDIKGPRFESSNRQNLVMNIPIYCYLLERTKIKEKRDRKIAHFERLQTIAIWWSLCWKCPRRLILGIKHSTIVIDLKITGRYCESYLGNDCRLSSKIDHWTRTNWLPIS